MINIKTFSYGEITKTLKKTITLLNKRGKAGYKEFDYPEYAGIDKRLSCRLRSDDVDFIQDHWHEIKR